MRNRTSGKERSARTFDCFPKSSNSSNCISRALIETWKIQQISQENTFVSCHKGTTTTTYFRQTFASLLYYLTRQSTVSNRAITLFYQQGFPKPCIVLASHVKGKVFDAKENKTRGQLNFQTELLTQRQVEQSIITSETPDSMHRHHMTLWYRWPVHLTKLSWKCAWAFPHHPVNAIWPERSHNQT